MLKPIVLFVLFLAFANATLAQVSGNANYQNKTYLSNYTANVGRPIEGEIFVAVKGLHNLKADAFVAVFNVTQLGKTAEEVNQLINERIATVKQGIGNNNDVDFFVDMISFVPVYEYEVEKKVFSKKTYNEVPQGFELKKNLHIRYTDPQFLETLIVNCAKAEIYDLVKVDYFSNNLEQEKAKLKEKAKALLLEKMTHYREILKVDSAYKKDMVDGFRVIYPVEMYQSYQAFSSASLNLNKSGKVNAADKSMTQYYQPVLDKDFDFVINPIIVEPVIQVVYEVNMVIKRPPEMQQKPQKEYHLITPTGEIKKLDMGN